MKDAYKDRRALEPGMRFCFPGNQEIVCIVSTLTVVCDKLDYLPWTVD